MFKIVHSLSLSIAILGVAALVPVALTSCLEVETKQMNAYVPKDECTEPSIEDFREPDNTRITKQKALCFAKASEAIAVMGQEWADKMSNVSSDEQFKFAALYERAQDEMLRKLSLAGIEEFDWIQDKALKDAANKDVFAQVGIFSR